MSTGVMDAYPRVCLLLSLPRLFAEFFNDIPERSKLRSTENKDDTSHCGHSELELAVSGIVGKEKNVAQKSVLMVLRRKFDLCSWLDRAGQKAPLILSVPSYLPTDPPEQEINYKSWIPRYPNFQPM